MKKYNIIYADPPWQYGSKATRSGKPGLLDYPTMSLNELCAMPVNKIAADNSALFMWYTGSFSLEAITVGLAWGFKPIRIDKVWIKKTSKGNRHAPVGPWGMSDCEFMMLFTKGKMCNQQIERNQHVSYEYEYPGKHSKKPRFFREQIENRFPSNFTKLEMFAREAPDGWDVFGNEVSNSISLDRNLKSIFGR